MKVNFNDLIGKSTLAGVLSQSTLSFAKELILNIGYNTLNLDAEEEYDNLKSQENVNPRIKEPGMKTRDLYKKNEMAGRMISDAERASQNPNAK